jgi:hypothetical protein
MLLFGLIFSWIELEIRNPTELVSWILEQYSMRRRRRRSAPTLAGVGSPARRGWCGGSRTKRLGGGGGQWQLWSPGEEVPDDCEVEGWRSSAPMRRNCSRWHDTWRSTRRRGGVTSLGRWKWRWVQWHDDWPGMTAAMFRTGPVAIETGSLIPGNAPTGQHHS